MKIFLRNVAYFMVIIIQTFIIRILVIRSELKIFFPPILSWTWNNLRHKFHSCTSLSTFKSQILTFIRPEPKLTFSINDRQGLKPLQIRIGLSLLKSHKKSHNFIDTPSDWCECNSAPENTYHYLPQCHLFQHSKDLTN